MAEVTSFAKLLATCALQEILFEGRPRLCLPLARTGHAGPIGLLQLCSGKCSCRQSLATIRATESRHERCGACRRRKTQT
eukprot:9196046-Pyramimonas_sp.AAC.1